MSIWQGLYDQPSALNQLSGATPPPSPGAQPSPSELAMNDILAQLTQRVMQSQGAAAGAQSAYQTAQAAPEPSIYAEHPARIAAASGLARLAEGLGATDHPAERVRQTIGAQQKSMSERRLANLKALHTNYEELAKRAEQLGDLEQTVKYKANADKVAREQLKIAEADKAANAMTQIRERNAGALAAANARIAGSATDTAARIRGAFDVAREHSRTTLEAARIRAKSQADATAARAKSPASFTNMSDKVDAVVNGEVKLFTFPVAERGEIVAQIHSSGRRIIPDSARKAISEMSAAETAIDEIEALSKQINTAKAGFDRLGKGADNQWKAFLQQGPAAELAAARGGLAGNLARAISAERGVLTDQDRKYAMGLIPGLYDSAPFAKSQLARLRRFLKSKREGAIRNYSTDLSKRPGPAATTEPGPSDAHSQVIDLLNSGDEAGAMELIQANPDLNDDPEINALYDSQFGDAAAGGQ